MLKYFVVTVLILSNALYAPNDNRRQQQGCRLKTFIKKHSPNLRPQTVQLLTEHARSYKITNPVQLARFIEIFQQFQGNNNAQQTGFNYQPAANKTINPAQTQMVHVSTKNQLRPLPAEMINLIKQMYQNNAYSLPSNNDIMMQYWYTKVRELIKVKPKYSKEEILQLIHELYNQQDDGYLTASTTDQSAQGYTAVASILDVDKHVTATRKDLQLALTAIRKTATRAITAHQ